MSDLDLRGGGAIAVDTETLRQTALRVDAAEQELEEIAARLGALTNMLLVEVGVAGDAASAASTLGTRLVEARRDAAVVAAALRDAAWIYDLVELEARYASVVLSGDPAAVARLDDARRAILAANPEAGGEASGLLHDRVVSWTGDLQRQSTHTGLLLGEEFVGPHGALVAGVGAGLAVTAGGAVFGLGGLGRVSRDARLATGDAAAAIRPVTGLPAREAPTTLAAAAARMPESRETRVRVEKYTMPDGSRQFALYVAGTSSLLLGGKDAWDMASNVDLYAGRQSSSSYVATQQALAAAGAEPGDVVHAFGHSQGAMIASHLAIAGDYDVQTLVSFGSPVEADVGAGTLSVGIRHTDDPIALLNGGGHMGSVGAPGSFVAERSADPSPGAHDLLLGAHTMSVYADTAALVDATTDPRVAALHDVLGGLAGAVEMEATEFAAERIEVSPAGGEDAGDRRGSR